MRATPYATLATARDLAQPIEGASQLLSAELLYAVESEWAVTLEDLLQRRCMVGLDADFGLRAAPAVAATLARLGIWDARRAADELGAYRELAARHGASPTLPS
jgi:glycerol-3-phosphate dehydrogenase